MENLAEVRLFPERRLPLSEHPHVKLKPLRPQELDFTKVRMSRIQQDIPVATDGCRWDQQGHRLSGTNPFVSETSQRFISGLVPVRRERLDVETTNLKCLRNLAFN